MRRALLLVAVTLLTACGSTADVATTSTTTTTSSTTTTSVATVAPTTTTTVAERFAQPLCAEPEFVPLSPEQATVTSASQRELEGDLATVRQYGAQHTDEYSDVGFAPAANPAKIAVWLTADHDRHLAAIKKLVAHPDRVVALPSMHSQRSGTRVFDAARNDPKVAGTYGSANGHGGRGAVGFDFLPTLAGRNAAKYAHTKWGKALCVTIASHPYPHGAWTAPTPCPPTGSVTGFRSFVDTTLVVDPTEVRRGEVGQAVLRISNRSDSAIELTTGGLGLMGDVVLPDTGEKVGFFSGAQNAMGRRLSVAPGETADWPVVFGTADCRPNGEYALPAGTYALRVQHGGNFPPGRATFRVVGP